MKVLAYTQKVCVAFALLCDHSIALGGRDNALLNGGLDLIVVPGLGFTQVRGMATRVHCIADRFSSL